jgi:curved DNA-binding protein CbpA
MADYYEVLQVHPRAEPDVIRAAFRTLARKYHPDFGGDPRGMMELNEAWTVLGDRERRAAYDATRSGHRTRPAPAAAKPQARPQPRPQPRSTGSEPEQSPAPQGSLAAAAERLAEAREDTPPIGRRSGSILDFGRYAGWSLGALAAHDPDYLLWLERTPIGRPLRAEIGGYLADRRAVTATIAAGMKGRRATFLQQRAR